MKSVGILIAKGKNAAIKKALESPLMQRKETWVYALIAYDG
jgi:hypothetical protein